MSPSPYHRRKKAATRRVQSGFSLVSAIFIVIVLSALGAAMTNLAVVQHTTSVQDLEGNRSYQAAKAGIEWALYQSLVGGVQCPSGSFALTPATLNKYRVTVNCAFVNQASANGAIVVRQVTATACNIPVGGACPGNSAGPYYVQRVLQVTYSN